MDRKDKNKELFKGMLIYSIGTFGTRILSIIIVPLYTYYISTEEMGVYDLLTTTMRLLTPLLTMQISDAAYRWMIRKERVSDCIGVTYRIVACGSLIYLCLISIVNFIWPIPYVWYFSFALISSRTFESTQKLLRGLKNQKLFAGSSIFYTLVFLSLNVLLIVRFRSGVKGLFISQISANILALVLIFHIEKRIRFQLFHSVDLKLTKEMLMFSIPLVPNLLNWWIMNASDRYVIGIFLGTAFNGIYAISYKFPNLLQQIFALFNNSWQDLAIGEDENDGKYFSDTFRRLYLIAFSLVPFFIVLCQLFVWKTMSPEYHDAAKYIGFLFLGTCFQAFSSCLGVSYLKAKNTKGASLTSIYGAAVNLIVHILLIQAIGLHAAAVSTFVGYGVMFAFRFVYSRRHFGVSVKWGEFACLLGFDVAVALISTASTDRFCYITIVPFILYTAVINKKLIVYLVNHFLKRRI